MRDFDEAQFLEGIRIKLDQQLLPLDSALSERLAQLRGQALQRLNSNAASEPVDESLLIDGVVTRLDDFAEPSGEIQQRLDRLRGQAIAQGTGDTQAAGYWERLRDLFSVQHRFGMGMVATACLTVAVVSVFYVSSNLNETFGTDPELTLVASADDLELYENLDFYLWLEENDIPD